MAKTKTPHHIDYDTLTVDGKFQKVARLNENPEVQLVECWAVRISPQSSQKAISCAKKIAIGESLPLQHLKRLVKEDTREGPKLLLLICSVLFFPSEDHLKNVFEKELDEKVTLQTIKVPQNYPPDKDKCAKWSAAFWPIVWRGSSVVQEMNAVRINVEEEKKFLQMAVDQALENFKDGKVSFLHLYSTNNSFR